MNSISTDILIVGGGPAGMAAALSSSSQAGISVTVVDDNPRLGGQIWRAELGRIKSRQARGLVAALDANRIKIVNNAVVFDAAGDGCLMAETPNGPLELRFKKLIIATGARERFLPFLGWTLPHVYGAAGLQALVKGGFDVKGKEIVVAGTGPLLLVAAEYLRSKGARILAVAEQTSGTKLGRFTLGLWRSPSKIAQAAALRLKLVGTRYLTDCWVTSARGTESFGLVELTRNGKNWTVQCDMLACGFHLVPNIELASMMGCVIGNGFVAVDEFQRTSCENVYCAGEPTGIGGVNASLVEGEIAGLAASGMMDEARRLFAERDTAARFGEMLGTTFALRDELKYLAADSTLVCRCEDVAYGRLKHFDDWRTAKLQSRCGMGACQGRVCGAATEFLFDWHIGGTRPPIFPVKLENL